MRIKTKQNIMLRKRKMTTWSLAIIFAVIAVAQAIMTGVVGDIQTAEAAGGSGFCGGGNTVASGGGSIPGGDHVNAGDIDLTFPAGFSFIGSSGTPLTLVGPGHLKNTSPASLSYTFSVNLSGSASGTFFISVVTTDDGNPGLHGSDSGSFSLPDCSNKSPTITVDPTALQAFQNQQEIGAPPTLDTFVAVTIDDGDAGSTQNVALSGCASAPFSTTDTSNFPIISISNAGIIRIHYLKTADTEGSPIGSCLLNTHDNGSPSSPDATKLFTINISDPPPTVSFTPTGGGSCTFTDAASDAALTNTTACTFNENLILGNPGDTGAVNLVTTLYGLITITGTPANPAALGTYPIVLHFPVVAVSTPGRINIQATEDVTDGDSTHSAGTGYIQIGPDVGGVVHCDDSTTVNHGQECPPSAQLTSTPPILIFLPPRNSAPTTSGGNTNGGVFVNTDNVIPPKDCPDCSALLKATADAKAAMDKAFSDRNLAQRAYRTALNNFNNNWIRVKELDGSKDVNLHGTGFYDQQYEDEYNLLKNLMEAAKRMLDKMTANLYAAQDAYTKAKAASDACATIRADNKCDNSASTTSTSTGGGVFATGGTLTIRNSTISGNNSNVIHGSSTCELTPQELADVETKVRAENVSLVRASRGQKSWTAKMENFYRNKFTKEALEKKCGTPTTLNFLPAPNHPTTGFGGGLMTSGGGIYNNGGEITLPSTTLGDPNTMLTHNVAIDLFGQVAESLGGSTPDLNKFRVSENAPNPTRRDFFSLVFPLAKGYPNDTFAPDVLGFGLSNGFISQTRPNDLITLGDAETVTAKIIAHNASKCELSKLDKVTLEEQVREEIKKILPGSAADVYDYGFSDAGADHYKNEAKKIYEEKLAEFCKGK